MNKTDRLLVPIVGATGVGYSLVEGYFLPPVSFTVEEAVLFTGRVAGRAIAAELT